MSSFEYYDEPDESPGLWDYSDLPDERSPEDSADAFQSSDLLPDEPYEPLIVETEYATTLDGGEVSIPTSTFFFRAGNYNVAAIANAIAPLIMAGRPEGATFRALDAGCADAKDTWTIAAVLSAHNIDYHIHALDISTRALERATQPYDTSKAELTDRSAAWGIPPSATDFFEAPDTTHIMPSAVLRERVTFQHADLRQPLPVAGGYDMIMANNVFAYYESRQPASVNAMLGNIAEKLRPGGLFTFSDRTTLNSHQLTDELLAAYGLVPAENTFGIPDRQWRQLAIYRKAADPGGVQTDNNPPPT